MALPTLKREQKAVSPSVKCVEIHNLKDIMTPYKCLWCSLVWDRTILWLCLILYDIPSGQWNRWSAVTQAAAIVYLFPVSCKLEERSKSNRLTDLFSIKTFLVDVLFSLSHLFLYDMKKKDIKGVFYVNCFRFAIVSGLMFLAMFYDEVPILLDIL